MGDKSQKDKAKGQKQKAISRAAEQARKQGESVARGRMENEGGAARRTEAPGGRVIQGRRVLGR